MLSSEELEKKTKALKVDYHQTFGTEQGKRVLKDLENRCFENHTTFAGAGKSEETHINIGSRSVILTINNMMKLSVEELIARRIV